MTKNRCFRLTLATMILTLPAGGAYAETFNIPKPDGKKNFITDMAKPADNPDELPNDLILID